MIVDVHTHASYYPETAPAVAPADDTMMRPDKPVSAAATWRDYAAAMEVVDRAIVFNIAYLPGVHASDAINEGRGARQVNDNTAALVRAHPRKLIGFLAVHPDAPDALAEIERSTGDLGLKGIKLGPNYQNFDPLGEAAFAVYRRAQEQRLPVLFHTGTSPVRFADLDYAHPRHIDRVAMAFPDLKIIMAHMSHPWQTDCICVIRKHPNVYADISALFYRPWSHYTCMRLATEWNVLPKLLFGSDYPVATPAETMAGMRAVNDPVRQAGLPLVPEDQIEAIIQRDSLALLGLA
ncbi:MAG: amidohydrolase [Chloroflexi bacterium]|nr:amidohydrolase [Chloroflexota bacterium]